MVGLSHRALRELIIGFGGLDLAFTEMASAGILVGGSPYERWYLDAEPEPSRIIYQLYATKPERLPVALAKIRDRPLSGRAAMDRTAKNRDGKDEKLGEAPAGLAAATAGPSALGIAENGGAVFGADINFGCAAPHITRAGGGAAWMREPAKAFALIASARAAWPANLSAKLRIGEDEDYERLADFCRGLAEEGIDFLTLHPRLESEKFRRKSRWDYIGRLAAELPIPLIGNGDIRSHADWKAQTQLHAPAGIMIGREAARRPWIFALIRGLEADSGFEMSVDLEATALRFLDLLETHLPEDFHLTRAQRFFDYYSDNFTYAHHMKWSLHNAVSIDRMRELLRGYFSEVPSDREKTERGESQAS